MLSTVFQWGCLRAAGRFHTDLNSAAPALPRDLGLNRPHTALPVCRMCTRRMPTFLNFYHLIVFFHNEICFWVIDGVHGDGVQPEKGQLAACRPACLLPAARKSATQLRFKCLTAFHICCDWYSVIVGFLTRFQVKLHRLFFFFKLFYYPKALVERCADEIQRIAGWSWMNSALFFSIVMLFIQSQINAWFLLEGFFFFLWKMGKSKKWMQPYIVAILF